MRTYRFPGGGLARALRHLGALVYTLASVSIAQAQERHNLFEVSAAGAYQSYGNTADLGSAFGGLGRIGLWLPLNFSVEAEGSTASAKANTTDIKVGVKTGSGALLYNLPFGGRSWGYAKLGYGGTKYGGDCSAPGARICGTTTMFVAGLGVRVGLTPVLMVRGEGVVHPNRGTTQSGIPPVSQTVKFSNYGVNLGVSLMLGSKPIPDSDGDGVLNNRDRCAGTPAGAQVDGRGCPADSDGDGVPNGVDRCPNSGTGALVDATGCSQDSDGDNIADGIDKCPDTPAGVLVDSRGCPRDSDGDSIADGLDRCSDTPKGATVDALGCPGDSDNDGVLDGLDRCPRTPPGADVNAAGCAAGQQGRQPPTAPAPAARPGDGGREADGAGRRHLRHWKRATPDRGLRGARLDREGTRGKPKPESGDRRSYRRGRITGGQYASLEPESRGGAKLPRGQGRPVPADGCPRLRIQYAPNSGYNPARARGQPKDRDPADCTRSIRACPERAKGTAPQA